VLSGWDDTVVVAGAELEAIDGRDDGFRAGCSS